MIDNNIKSLQEKQFAEVVELILQHKCRASVGGVSKRRILFFYKQSPDFHKPGLCHVQKILYL